MDPNILIMESLKEIEKGIEALQYNFIAIAVFITVLFLISERTIIKSLRKK